MRNIKRTLIFTMALLLLLPLAGTHEAGSAYAQTQYATVTGRVTDEQDAVVPGATVTLTHLATNTSQQTRTNDEGLFVFGNVAAGTYEVRISKENFRTVSRQITVAVAQRLEISFVLPVGEVTEVVTVEALTETVNLASGDIARTVSQTELENLPLLTRNPYALVALAAGASDTAAVTGDTRGLGLAVAGGRTSSVNFMLDGGENNDTFVAGLGQTVPLDAVAEFKVQLNNMSAEFGRNAAVTNVVTRSGSNEFHGSAYEYYRGAGLSTETFDDKASGTPKSNFVRNQFGASAGGPIFHDKTFFFGSFEGLRVRSSGTSRFFVPTSDFFNASSPETRNFLNAFGGLPSSNCADAALTAEDIVVGIEGAPTYAGNELVNANTGAIIPAATRLFCRTTLRAPIDAGGGLAQNTWLWTGRIDHNFSDRTSLMGRYAFNQTSFPDGVISLSPYEGFNTGQRSRNQNMNLTLRHSFTPTMFSETRLIYNRVLTEQPLGEAPGTTPCWFYDLAFSTPTGDQITFPGYVPNVCVFAGIPFGGPQNIYQVAQNLTWSRGRHTWKWGGQYVHMRDNRVFGAFQNAFQDTFIMQGMLDGQVDFIFVAIDPKGKFPGDTYNTSVDGPFVQPRFDRHYWYNEVGLFVEDSIKLHPRFTLNLGLRWEYFGVLHSPQHERFLDANLFLDAVGPFSPSKTIFEQIRDARFSRTNNLFQQDWNNFAPRIGFAWDVTGRGRTVFRGGYGLFYDRNFGNALFNVIQNFPNYAVISQVPLGSFGVQNAPIMPNQFDTLNALAGAAFTITGSARMLDREMATAYSTQWNATLEHDVFGKGIITSLSYVGSNGIKLYSLNNLNQLGSCLLAPTINPTCVPDGGRTSRLNQTGLTGMNRRGNEGLSRYNAMALDVRTRRIGSTGLMVAGNYTWAHSIDNSSSFFGDSPFEGLFGFGFRDPFNPALDRASSTNDIRHRGTISFNWEVPWGRSQTGFAGHVLGGWTLSGIYIAQTGGAFTVYDGSSSSQCNNSGTNFCHPVLVGSVPARTQTPVSGAANSFTLYNIGSTFQTQQQFCASAPNPLACTAELYILNPEQLSPRNLFRTPGIWNADFAVFKDFRLPWEGTRLQARVETFNVFNHSNLYVVPGTNQYTGPASTVTGKRGVSPSGTVDRRNIQLALRLLW
jgi:hypothetical protein